ncbi:MAG TPA: class I SAM-dependent methyltransferase [bacterium]|nr:class I SAM-dependent methyltransferase [bacterium]
MAKITPFEEHSDQYESWFSDHHAAYESELSAVKELLPPSGSGVEIGVGSGRFAAPLGIQHGVEPSEQMRRIAEQRGIATIAGVAEQLPYQNENFDFALMVTTLCFLDDVTQSFREVRRILTPGGAFLIGFIARESPLGQLYERYKEQNVFYRVATFYSVEEGVSDLRNTGFTDFKFTQTIFRPLEEITAPEPVKPGYGDGSFVVIRAMKPQE